MKLHCREFSKPFSLAAGMLFMLLWFPWCSHLAPVTEVGPGPVLQTPSTTDPQYYGWYNWSVLWPSQESCVCCLSWFLCSVINIPYCIAQVLSPRTQDTAILWQFCKTTLRDILPRFFPLCSAQAGFCSSPLQVRTKEHLALNQAGFITFYGNFHNTNIKIVGQDSISLSATVAKVSRDGFRRCCSTSYCTLQGLMSLWWWNAREGFWESPKIELEETSPSPPLHPRLCPPSWQIQVVSGHTCKIALPITPAANKTCYFSCCLLWLWGTEYFPSLSNSLCVWR